MRVPEFLTEQSVPFETIVHPPAFTAQKRARFLRVSGSRVAKNVLLHGPHAFFLAVLPATHHVDTERLAAALGGSVRLATDEEIAGHFSDCEWGVVPPLGTLYGLKTVLDDSFPPDSLIIFETNYHAEAVRLLCRDFEKLERPQRLRFASPWPLHPRGKGTSQAV
jgi:Ala-tRNA(Pro) deacylase